MKMQWSVENLEWAWEGWSLRLVVRGVSCQEGSLVRDRKSDSNHGA